MLQQLLCWRVAQSNPAKPGNAGEALSHRSSTSVLSPHVRCFLQAGSCIACECGCEHLAARRQNLPALPTGWCCWMHLRCCTARTSVSAPACGSPPLLARTPACCTVSMLALLSVMRMQSSAAAPAYEGLMWRDFCGNDVLAAQHDRWARLARGNLANLLILCPDRFSIVMLVMCCRVPECAAGAARGRASAQPPGRGVGCRWLCLGRQELQVACAAVEFQGHLKCKGGKRGSTGIAAKCFGHHDASHRYNDA